MALHHRVIRVHQPRARGLAHGQQAFQGERSDFDLRVAQQQQRSRCRHLGGYPADRLAGVQPVHPQTLAAVQRRDFVSDQQVDAPDQPRSFELLDEGSGAPVSAVREKCGYGYGHDNTSNNPVFYCGLISSTCAARYSGIFSVLSVLCARFRAESLKRRGGLYFVIHDSGDLLQYVFLVIFDFFYKHKESKVTKKAPLTKIT